MGREIHRDSRDWYGRKFIQVSLAVTALSIIFFFAGRQVFNKIEVVGEENWHNLWSELVSRGGLVISEVEWVNREDSLNELSAIYFEEEVLQDLLSRPIGQLRWNFRARDLHEKLADLSWTRDVEVRRRFVDRVEVAIQPRQPTMILRGRTGWVLVDTEGHFLVHQNELSGAWVHLPIVYGLEQVLSLDVTSMNRRLVRESNWLADLAELMKALDLQMGIEVARVEIQEELWKQQALYTLHWRANWATETDPWHELKVYAGLWRGRLTSLQYILSDLSEQMAEPWHITGPYESRWYVRSLVKEGSGGG